MDTIIFVCAALCLICTTSTATINFQICQHFIMERHLQNYPSFSSRIIKCHVRLDNNNDNNSNDIEDGSDNDDN